MDFQQQQQLMLLLQQQQRQQQQPSFSSLLGVPQQPSMFGAPPLMMGGGGNILMGGPSPPSTFMNTMMMAGGGGGGGFSADSYNSNNTNNNNTTNIISNNTTSNNTSNDSHLRSAVLDDEANFKFIAKPTETAIKGFTKDKFTNPFIPSYVPPEVMVLESGLFLNAFLARCSVHDYTRLIQQEQEESYFANIEVKVKYDSKGNKVNVASEMLIERNQKALAYLKKLIAQFRNETVRDGEVSRKYYFKPHEIPLIGSLFGARGETQKMLVKESGVLRIEFAGKGLTKRQKRFNAQKGTEKNEALENEEPHAFIVGYDEVAVGRAIEKIEWLLSDAPDAITMREDNRRRLMVKDGTYDPLTYKPKETIVNAAGMKRGRDEDGKGNGGDANAVGNATTTVAEVADDEDLDKFLDDM